MRISTLAFRNVLRNKRRTMITLLSIIVGVSSLVLFDGFIEYTLWGLRESTIKSGLGHVQVTSNEKYYVSGSYEPFSFLLKDDKKIISVLKNQPEVKYVVPQIKFTGTMSFEGRSGMARMTAYPVSERTDIHDFVSITEGRELSAGDEYAAVLGAGVAKKLGVGLRDEVTLLSVTGTGGVNASDFKVVGIASLGNRELDNISVFIPLEGASDFLYIDSVPLISVVLHDTSQTRDFTSRIGGILEHNLGRSLTLKRWDELADYYIQAKELYGNMLVVTKFIIMFIVAFAIINTMTMAIMERTREIGTLRAVGTKKKNIMLLFVYEGCILGFFGGVLGVITAHVCSILINDVFGGIYISPPPGRSVGYYALFTPTLSFSISMIYVSTLVSFVGSLYPSYQAVDSRIADALRHV